LSAEPQEYDIRLSKETSELISAVIQMGFDINGNVPPMPPFPAIPLKNLTKLVQDAEAYMHQTIMLAKQLKKHGMAKHIEIGPLVTALASIDIPQVRIHFE